jgi:hypothetical protein
MFQAMKRGGMTAMFVGHGKFFLGTGWYWTVLDGTGWSFSRVVVMLHFNVVVY